MNLFQLYKKNEQILQADIRTELNSMSPSIILDTVDVYQLLYTTAEHILFLSLHGKCVKIAPFCD